MTKSRRPDELSRRDFLSYAALSLLGVSAMPFASPLFAGDPEPASGTATARRPTAKSVIYLYMSGGMSHIDTFDTKPGAANQGPLKSIPTAVDGVQLSEHFPMLAEQMPDIALIRGLSSNQGAHEQGNYVMHTSFIMRGTIKHPCMGSWMLHFGGRPNRTLPGNVVIGAGTNYPGNGYLEPDSAPLLLGKASDGLQHSALPPGVDDAEFSRRLGMARDLNSEFLSKYPTKSGLAYKDIYDQAVALMKSSDLTAFDLSQESKAVRDAYGDDGFAQGCLLARRLVEHGVRYVEVDLGGWDTHADNFERVGDLSAKLDRGLGTLLPDLRERGLLDDTLIVVGTEFGRTPDITDNDGRNHYPKAFSGLLAGGGIRGGRAFGKTDETGANVVENKLDPADFNATIAYAAGLPLDEVVHSPSGRPFTLADKGHPAMELFA
jgi:hypothetical protein